MSTTRPRLAVWKFASCDGCQLTLLDAEEHLLEIAAAVDIAYFPEATKGEIQGRYDLSLVEGSVTTPHDADRIQQVREISDAVVTIGACATAGGIQALRNWADVDDFLSIVYAQPDYIDTLQTSTPIGDHIPVDFELRGCPISKNQLLEVIDAFLNRRAPDIPGHSVCVECKMRGVNCVMVAQRIPCMGPITQAGCGALCPAYDRGCYGCFGPSEAANVDSLAGWWRDLGVPDGDLVRALRTFNAYAPEFRRASEAYEH
ncbi:MAG: oxidoreductase [Actinomycetota bacterium]